MLRLYRGAKLQSLADTLLDEFSDNQPENLLVPELFVVQNYGMARWLSLYIAEKEGIAANLEFKFPAEIYWQIMRMMNPDIPGELASDRIPMSWTIFELLQLSNDPALSELYQYIQNGTDGCREMRCWDLARQIADVFDQYLTYRPQMVLAWEQGDLSTGFTSERWQAAVWRKLAEHWRKQGINKQGHRAALHRDLINSIDDEEIPANMLPRCITIFGVSEMPETYVQMLVKLSKLTAINFYMVDLDRNRENQLVNSLGKTSEEFMFLLEKHTKANNDGINIEKSNVSGGQPTASNFFETVKHGLINGVSPGSQVKADGSVRIHSCHSPRREVEVLYDQLLHMLDEDHVLNPSDIMVLCPQMDIYGPEIEAVFGAVEKGMPEIPYHMAEKGAETNIIFLAFRKLLRIVDSRLKVTEMLDLLDSEPIRNAFSFSHDDVNMLEKWIGDNHIRWGINAEQKQSFGLPPTDSFTWRAGLNRMMAGYAMQTRGDQLFQQIYPYDEIQQMEHAQLLGRFSQFLNNIIECHGYVSEKMSLSQWSKIFSEWLSQFFTKDDTHFGDLQYLGEIIHSLGAHQQRGYTSSHVSFRVARSFLEDQLDQKATGGGRPGRGVTFAGMIPMRNIPAKVVCMIGMNDGTFPRRRETAEFNLITKNPEEGDRLPGNEDRQIFLENILATGQQLYLSYTGQSNEKEVQYPPSVVVREFIDYLIQHHGINEDNISQFHRLQSFSTIYFKQNEGDNLFSYSLQNRNVADQLINSGQPTPAFLQTDLPEPDDSYKKLTIRELVSFFQHPAKFLLQQRLGIYLREDEILDEDREFFSLDSLQEYQIGQEMLDRYLDDQSSIQAFKEVAYVKDVLPEGWPGKQAFDCKARQVEKFGREIQQEIDKGPLNPVEVDYKIGQFQIVGKLEQLFSHGQLQFRLGKMKPKYLIELWIKHLLFQLVRPEEYAGKSTLITIGKKQPIERLTLPSLKNAEIVVSKLMKMYWEGLQKPICFFPESSYSFVENMQKNDKNEVYALEQADNKWDSRWAYINESDDIYNKKIYEGCNPILDRGLKNIFKTYSNQFWNPFFKVLAEN